MAAPSARRGYWAPTPDEIQRANMLAHANDPPAPLKLQPARHMSKIIRPWFGISRGDNGKTRVTFVWEPAGVVPGDRHVKTPTQIAMKAVGQDGATAYEGMVSEHASATFDVTAGRTAVTMSIQDAAANPIDSDVRDIVIRDLKGAVVLGTPQVFRARTAKDVRELRETREAVPIAAREFSRAERLLIRVPTYGSTAVTAALLNPSKQPMRQLPVESLATSALMDVPLAALPPGQYSVTIAAKSPAGSAQDSVAFRIVD